MKFTATKYLDESVLDDMTNAEKSAWQLGRIYEEARRIHLNCSAGIAPSKKEQEVLFEANDLIENLGILGLFK